MADQAAQASPEATVEVKFLRQVGPYQAGQVAVISEKQADKLCAPSIQTDGLGTFNRQKAVRTADLANLAADVDVSLLTQAEMDAAGRKNFVIESPYDTHSAKSAFETAAKAADLTGGVDSGEAVADTKPPVDDQPPVDQPPVVDPAPPLVLDVTDSKGKKKK